MRRRSYNEAYFKHNSKQPETKIEAETINKLSYQTWALRPKEQLPWAQKGTYQRPEHPMISDTVYHMSYPVPGHYVEDESCKEECPCPTRQDDDASSASAKAC